MLARVPDSGSRTRDRQGPRPAVRLAIRAEIRSRVAHGSSPSSLAAEYRLSVRTVYRYIAEPTDPVRAVIAQVLEEARREFELALSRDQVDDVATEVARRLRARRHV